MEDFFKLSFFLVLQANVPGVWPIWTQGAHLSFYRNNEDARESFTPFTAKPRTYCYLHFSYSLFSQKQGHSLVPLPHFIEKIRTYFRLTTPLLSQKQRQRVEHSIFSEMLVLVSVYTFKSQTLSEEQGGG